MKNLLKKKTRLRRAVYFFPLQLFFVVIKKNQFLIFFWALMFGFVTKLVAPRYGLPYLFLDPEYMGKSGMPAYAIVGFACGGFIMAFNISAYIMNAFRFPFLATVARPFFKFCLNNFIFPVLFVITYSFYMTRFQVDQSVTSSVILLNLSGFYLGLVLFIALSLTYFASLNKDLFKMFNLESNEHLDVVDIERKEDRDWHVETYLSGFNKISLARKYQHYEKDQLMRVFKQNHFNAAIFEILAMISLLILGLFNDHSFFEIPAAASVILLLTLFIMLPSALHTWLRGWSTTVSVLLLIVANYLYSMEIFSGTNKAYGMNYKTEKAEYSYNSLNIQDSSKTLRNNDINHTIEILNKWRLRNMFAGNDSLKKPKLIIINTSGGGLRSSLWTFLSLQYADSILNGKLLKQTVLMSGSSGGSIGAAYLRELYLQKLNNKVSDIYSDTLLNDISEDILNPLAIAIATHDLFFRVKRFSDGQYSYIKDRGYAFEEKLNKNTHNLLKKRLKDYIIPEKEAFIPMMIFTPAIVNDGRRLIISAQPVSYLAQNYFGKNVDSEELIENIEFSRFFAKQDALNLRFTTALRMNSSFPYIMPMVTLPSSPEIKLMDAGMRDNYGLEISMKFLHTFRNWIATNTSGIIIIQTRDRPKTQPIEDIEGKTISQTLSTPLSSFYNNLFQVQDYNHNQLLEYAGSWFDGPIDIIDFELENKKNDNISLSWHLTQKEKNMILKSVQSPQFNSAIEKLSALLNQ